mmetsp:Transcript_26536/g.64477  ORF Transcript_26536/g.64477 Transcript_26536/m.64477 type:complete len:269 (-) Transcript_26536:1765-2571(-)
MLWCFPLESSVSLVIVQNCQPNHVCTLLLRILGCANQFPHHFELELAVLDIEKPVSVRFQKLGVAELLLAHGNDRVSPFELLSHPRHFDRVGIPRAGTVHKLCIQARGDLAWHMNVYPLQRHRRLLAPLPGNTLPEVEEGVQSNVCIKGVGIHALILLSLHVMQDPPHEQPVCPCIVAAPAEDQDLVQDALHLFASLETDLGTFANHSLAPFDCSLPADAGRRHSLLDDPLCCLAFRPHGPALLELRCRLVDETNLVPVGPLDADGAR